MGCVVVAVALTACSAEDEPAPPGDAAPVEVAWEAAALPVPPGPAGRTVLRDVAWCDGTWYAVGGVQLTSTLGSDPYPESRPAWWSSTDGRTWTSRDLAPEDYFAKGAVLLTVGCHGDDVAAVGARPGGAHGNPRTSSWYLREDGVLVDVPAAFTLYGGVEAVNTARMVGGPRGWTISGNRLSGAAVWTSSDAHEFELVDTDPALMHDEEHRFLAIAQTATPDGWVLVGNVLADGAGQLGPQAWSSADGRTWSREDVPTTDRFADLERVTTVGDDVVALGVRGDGFGVWRRDAAGTWSLGAAFGALDPDRSGAPAVSGITASDVGLMAAVTDGSVYRLWSSPDGETWREVATPPGPPHNAADQTMALASDGTTVLLLADDGETAALWTSDAGAYAGS